MGHINHVRNTTLSTGKTKISNGVQKTDPIDVYEVESESVKLKVGVESEFYNI